MNSVVLIGRLARDPELSYTPNTQTAVCKFTLAVDRPRRNGEDQGADFLRITVFGRQAETCDRYLQKGRQAAVHGRIETGSYKNREGVTVYTTDIVADRVEFLGGGNGQGGQGSYQNQGSSYQGVSYQGNQGTFERSQGFSGDMPDTGFSPVQDEIGGFDDLPDTFQAAEDDIPF
jgi:single-strand DNA-binding protein